MKPSLPEWLNSFDIGESRYLPVTDQSAADNIVRQVQAKSRRRDRTKNWKFVCRTLLALDVSTPTDQQFILEVSAVSTGSPKDFKL